MHQGIIGIQTVRRIDTQSLARYNLLKQGQNITFESLPLFRYRKELIEIVVEDDEGDRIRRRAWI
jgi:hypothetical protein